MTETWADKTPDVLITSTCLVSWNNYLVSFTAEAPAVAIYNQLVIRMLPHVLQNCSRTHLSNYTIFLYLKFAKLGYLYILVS